MSQCRLPRSGRPRAVTADRMNYPRTGAPSPGIAAPPEEMLRVSRDLEYSGHSVEQKTERGSAPKKKNKERNI